MSADPRMTAAREYLASVRQHKVSTLPPSVLVRECAELRRQLGQVLDAIGEAGEAAKLTQIRQLLAGFDWEFHDRQLALEAIERIVTGDGR